MTAGAAAYYHPQSFPMPHSDADADLERIVQAARPVIRDVCGATLGSGHADLEDACAEALVRVIARVRQQRRSEEGMVAIQNVPAYAAVTARRVCADYLRRAHPVRARLATRVRYALTRDPGLRVRRTGAGIAVAGLAPWDDTRPPAPRGTASAIASELRPAIEGAALLQAIRAVLARADGWVEVGALIGALFDAAALKDPTFTQVEDEHVPAPEAPDSDADQSWRDRLAAAWREIVLLPAPQRTALLLQLRGDEGRSALPLLVLAGIAALPAIADALALTPAALAELVPSLPLDDLKIAARLGVTRQQVINLRKSARARLSRRVGGVAPAVVIPGRFGRHIKREPS